MELTADALNSFSHVLPTGFFNKISETLGIPIEKTKSTMMTTIPAVISELQKIIRGPEGIQNIATAIHSSGFDDPVSMTSDVSNINVQINKGQDVLNKILPRQADSLLGKVTTAAGVNSSQGSKLLGAASAAVFSFIGSKMKDGTLSASAFANILGQSSGAVSDISASVQKYASSTTPFTSAPTHLKQSSARTYWPWVLLAVALGIIWWSQGRNSAPLLSRVTATSETIPAPTGTTTFAATDQTVMSELSQFLANPAAVAPRVFSLHELNFATGSAVLSTEGSATVTALASLLNQYPEARIRIVGHTDNVGIESANQKLSLDRAESLKQSLIEQGIAGDRIETAGMGSTQPMAENISEDGRSQNRRLDIEVIRR